MKVRKTVFGSKSEKKLFNTLNSRWSKDYDLYPSLPLSCIIENPEPSLSPSEVKFFYKTSIDFTLCTKNGWPILSIEFDGLGKGFSRHGEYIKIEESSDPHRKLKLDLKLRVAKDLGYPLFVISYEEIEAIDQDLSLTIVDGIIGQTLAKKEFNSAIQNLYNENREQIESLPPSSQQDYVQDLVTDAETLAALKYDPIAKLEAEIEGEAFRKGIVESFRFYFLNDPKLPDGDMFNSKVMKERVKLIKEAKRVGCRIIVKTPKVVIVKTIWLRNFEDSILSPLSIASNIAHLLAFKQALDIVKTE